MRTKQETFDHVVTALRRQGKPAANEASCMYRIPAPNGSLRIADGALACAAGHCVDDDHPKLAELVKGNEAIRSMDVESLAIFDGDLDVLRRLQNAHDSAQLRGDNFLSRFLERAAGIASEFGLDAAVTRAPLEPNT